MASLTLLTGLALQCNLPIVSTEDLAMQVTRKLHKRTASGELPYGAKRPTPLSDLAASLPTRPVDVLHTLGSATTLFPHSPFAEISRQWAQLRYCASLERTRKQVLCLSQAANDLVYHHKTAQSEHLGIGLAVVVARAALQRRYPRWTFDVVDAEMALKAGFIDGAGTVRESNASRKRPDYFLVGRHQSRSRWSSKLFVLECKGTHGDSHHIKQLSTACTQVRSVEIGGRTPAGLMVASTLRRSGITAYILDPPGDEELWSGPADEAAEMLGTSPGDIVLPVISPPSTEPQHDQSEPLTDRAPSADSATANDQPSAQPAPFRIPNERRGWLFRLLSRSAASSALLFAGNASGAAEYATPRQRAHEHPSGQLPLGNLAPEYGSTARATIHLGNGMRFEGTRHRLPLPNQQTLEVFRGMERRPYELLAEGQVRPYFSAAQRVFSRSGTLTHTDGRQLVSVAPDATALIMRIIDTDG